MFRRGVLPAYKRTRVRFRDSFAMSVSSATLALLLKPRAPMECRDPQFPTIVLTESECKTFKFFCTPTFFIIIFPKTHTMHVGFFERTFSNFVRVDMEVEVGGNKIVFRCGEELFKAKCVMAHLDSPDNEHNMKVLDAVLNAAEPKIAKKASSDIHGFKAGNWNSQSYHIMFLIQLLKFTNDEFRMFVLQLVDIAKHFAIKPETVSFMEATSRDDLWGTGVRIEDVYSQICADGVANFKGRNLLGKAIGDAFVELASHNYVGLDESMDEFVARIMSKDGFRLFEIEHPAKRAKTTAD